jgi:hypothetical protein
LTTNLIIGAGQLGSRHLQGLLKASLQQQVYVLDPFPASLEMAAARAAEVQHSAPLHFVNSWDQLPPAFDLVIVATGADVRAAVVQQLLENHTVRYLVLEKVMFQDVDSYNRIAALLHAKQVTAWVNHPRRMFTHYRQIRALMAAQPGPLVFTATGVNWGLACNALHLVDLCCFLTGSAVAELDLQWTDPVIHPSKRPGYIEFTGTVRGRLEDNSVFIITSLDGDPGVLTVQASAATNRWLVQEGAQPSMITYTRLDGFATGVHTKLVNEFQSGLSTRLAEALLHNGSCELPTYAEACLAHVPFITAALTRYNELGGYSALKIPIT